MFGVIRDITCQRELEQKLQETTKMAAISTLAGGIAHDFNNLLMAIQGNASLMRLGMDPGHPFYRRVMEIEEQIQRGANLTRQLLGFARRGKYDVRPTDLNLLLGKLLEMFGRTRKEVLIQTLFHPTLPLVEADPGQVEQLFFNLFLNAADAMPEGGSLSVETQAVLLDEAFSERHEVAPGPYVRIVVQDTGTGMDEKTMGRIFEPFFTTKEVGRGTGLGLASAYGIVKNHGGVILVHSVLGKGSTFTVYFPAMRDPEIAPPLEERGPGRLHHGSGTILLVDDEPMVTDVGRQMLEHLGYTVLVAQGGEEALSLYEKNHASIDLVILDMVMPVMGGEEVFRRLKSLDPQVKVLLSSGYSLEHKAGELLDLGCRGFIQKPFTLPELSQKVCEILEQGEAH